jgi:uncharacterized caspase-like protein
VLLRVSCLIFSLWGLCMAWPAQAQVQAEPEPVRRVALVVGNNDYQNAPLTNPVNDARAMATALQSAGFDVILRTDTTQPELLSALRDFGNRLREGGPGTAGLFYFAGHGMQIKGRNFLIPVGANIEHEDEVSYQSLDAQAVMDKMESAGNGTNIVILDACRNNPFVRSFRSASQGLAQMDAPVGTLVAFSTAPGSVASDGLKGGENGLYTSHLLQVLQRPGLKVEDVFKQVRAGVLRDSQNKQVPWESSSMVGDFYFRAPAPQRPTSAAAAPVADTQAVIDDALWSAVKDSSSSAELFAYLNRYPAGRHAKAARSRLADLVAPSLSPTMPVAPATESATSPWPASVNPSGSIDVDEVLRRAANDERQRQVDLIASQQRIDEIVTWGDVGTDRRPANPKRNANGFTEGDRYRWRVLDRTTERYGNDYLWRIDRIEPDGSLWVNDGRQRLDPLGQLRGGNEFRSGQWVDWLPPLPVNAALRAAAGAELPVVTTVQYRDAQGRIAKARLSGRLLGGVPEVIDTPKGRLPGHRVEAHLEGPAVRANGDQWRVTLHFTWWMVPGIGLPVHWSVEEREDDRLVQRTLHELSAVDAASFNGATATAGK